MSNNCTARNDLLVALHTLASHFENALYAFGDDDEARKKAEGDIAWARLVASRHNYNGSECKEIERLREGERAADAEIERLHNERMLLLSSNKIVLQPPAISESEVTSILRREIEFLNADIVRLRQANSELAALADGRYEEIERLRELLREGIQYPSGEPPLWRKRVREALGDE